MQRYCSAFQRYRSANTKQSQRDRRRSSAEQSQRQLIAALSRSYPSTNATRIDRSANDRSANVTLLQCHRSANDRSANVTAAPSQREYSAIVEQSQRDRSARIASQTQSFGYGAFSI
jgi:hypothetical protein